MAFKIVQSATYKWPVKITLALDNGKRCTDTFTAEFKRLPQDRINEIVKEVRRSEYDRDLDETINDQDACREIMVGWSDVVDDDGEAVPFSTDALNELLNIPTVASQIVTHWFGSLDNSKRKN